MRSARLLSLFWLLVTAASLAAASPAPTTPAAGAAPGQAFRWNLSFELAFGEGSPYSRRFGSYYRLPYASRLAVTREVMDQVVDAVVEETGVRKTGDILYGPGGYQEYPPEAAGQLPIQGTEEQVRDAMTMMGCLAQQSEVWAYRPAPDGATPALEIVQEGGRSLLNVSFAERFWARLGKHSPKLYLGFSTFQEGRSVGIRIVDAGRTWTAADVCDFDRVVRALGAEHRRRFTTRRATLHLLTEANNWKEAPDGECYRESLRRRGREPLADRLRLYQPLMERWIETAMSRVPLLAGAKARSRSAASPLRKPRSVRRTGVSRAAALSL